MSTTARGYGATHQALRKQVARQVQAGHAVCTRCHTPIAPDAQWDLDHTDDRTSYQGPAHAHCNRSAGGHKGNRARRTQANPTSRHW